MKTFAAVISAVHTNKEVFTLSAENRGEALHLADELMGELIDEGAFDEDDAIDVDVIDLDEVTHVTGKLAPDSDDETECVKTLADLIRFSRDTDGEIPDRVLARILLDGMLACEDD